MGFYLDGSNGVTRGIVAGHAPKAGAIVATGFSGEGNRGGGKGEEERGESGGRSGKLHCDFYRLDVKMSVLVWCDHTGTFFGAFILCLTGAAIWICLSLQREMSQISFGRNAWESLAYLAFWMEGLLGVAWGGNNS